MPLGRSSGRLICATRGQIVKATYQPVVIVNRSTRLESPAGSKRGTLLSAHTPLLNLANPGNPNSQVAISIWVNGIEARGYSTGPELGGWFWSNQPMGFYVDPLDNLQGMFAQENPVYYRSTVIASGRSWIDRWYHFVLVWDCSSSMMRTYRNGITFGAPTVTGTVKPEQNFFLGTNRLDDCAVMLTACGIWHLSTDLSTTELQTFASNLYNGGNALCFEHMDVDNHRLDDCSHFWNLNEFSDGTQEVVRRDSVGGVNLVDDGVNFPASSEDFPSS